MGYLDLFNKELHEGYYELIIGKGDGKNNESSNQSDCTTIGVKKVALQSPTGTCAQHHITLKTKIDPRKKSTKLNKTPEWKTSIMQRKPSKRKLLKALPSQNDAQGIHNRIQKAKPPKFTNYFDWYNFIYLCSILLPIIQQFVFEFC